MKIELKAPDTPYVTVIDPQVMDVILRDVFNGVTLKTDDGQNLSICMRDDGFEVHYYSDKDEDGKSFDSGWTEFKQANIVIK